MLIIHVGTSLFNEEKQTAAAKKAANFGEYFEWVDKKSTLLNVRNHIKLVNVMKLF